MKTKKIKKRYRRCAGEIALCSGLDLRGYLSGFPVETEKDKFDAEKPPLYFSRNGRFYLEGHWTPYKAKDFRKIRYHWDIGSQYYIELTMKNHDVITIWHTYLEAEISGKYYSQVDLYRYFDSLSKGGDRYERKKSKS